MNSNGYKIGTLKWMLGRDLPKVVGELDKP
jgi:hypothetical protein